jgi:hypothetical protein
MTHDRQRKTVVLTAFAEDRGAIAPRIAKPFAEVVWLDEEASANEVPKTADIVVFVLSAAACYSTQLKSIVAYVHDHVRAAERYLLTTEDFDISRLVFPEIKNLPRMTFGELEHLLRQP